MTILQDLEAARDALAGVKAMLPSDVPELPDTERISGSFIYLRWQELREVKAALSRLSTLIEQVRGQEAAVDVDALELPDASDFISTLQWRTIGEMLNAYARAALRMHLTGGK